MLRPTATSVETNQFWNIGATTMSFKSTASSAQSTVGADLTLVERFKVDTSGALVTTASTDAALKIYQIGSNVNSYDCRLQFMQDAGWRIEAPRYNENTNSAYDFGINYNRNQYAGDFYIANNGTRRLTLTSAGVLHFGGTSTSFIYNDSSVCVWLEMLVLKFKHMLVAGKTGLLF